MGTETGSQQDEHDSDEHDRNEHDRDPDSDDERDRDEHDRDPDSDDDRDGMTLPPTRVEPSPRWVRAALGGRTVADSRRAMLQVAFGPPLLPGTQRPLLPGYFFPFEDVEMDVLTPAGVRDGRHWWHADVDGTHVEHAAWAHDQPEGATGALAGHLTFRWEVMDAWYEEAEEVFVHARDPHKRVDVLGSTRHVQVAIDGLVLADTHEPFLVFETHLPTRYYLLPRDVRTDLLVDSDTVTACPYKGVAQYWSLDGAGDVGRDIAWSYPDPVPEQALLATLICFSNEKLDILVDGEPQARPVTPWS